MRKGGFMLDIILGISAVIISGILFVKTKQQEDKERQFKESNKHLEEDAKNGNTELKA